MKTIQSKLVSSFGVLIALSVLMTLSGYYSFKSFVEGSKLTEEIGRLKVQLVQIANHEKDFLLDESIDTLFFATGNSQNLQKSEWLANRLSKSIMALSEEYNSNFELNSQLMQLDEMMKLYVSRFKTFVGLKYQVGFKDWGRVGQLRHAIHQIEQSDIAYDRVHMLTLRRHEKDFLLRKDVRYLEKFKREKEVFVQHIVAKADMRQGDKERLVDLLNVYAANFEEVVEGERKIGFSYREGFRNELKAGRGNAMEILSELEQTAAFIREEKVVWGVVQFALFFIGQLIFGLVFAIRFSKRFSGKILSLKRSIMNMAEKGELTNIEVSGQDEMSELAGALGKLNNRIAVAIQFSNLIGEGQLKAVYPKEYQEGMLEKALIGMQGDLQAAQMERDQENWIADALMRASELLRENADDISLCYDKLIALLVEILDSQLGGIFLLQKENDKHFLHLQAAYAYGQNRFRQKNLALDEGLVGQAFMEKEMLYITDIPHDYYQIFSGLGNLQPNALLVVPLVVNDEAIGVFEVASLNGFSEYQQRFCQKVAETVAYGFMNQRQGAAFRQMPEWIRKQDQLPTK